MRTEEFAKSLPAEADAALILSPKNRFYFTGFPSTDGCLFISREKSVFFTDSRYSEAASRQIKNCLVIERKDLFSQLNELFLSEGVKAAALESSVCVADFDRYKNKLPEIKFTADGEIDELIIGMRSIKSEAELENIKTAQSIAEKAFDFILSFISAGKTEREIALELDYYMLKNGAEAVSFDTIAVSGANSSMPHGVPSEKKIEKGDLLTLDFGAVYKGYHSDMTRTVAVGRPSGEQARVYNIVLEAQKRSLGTLRVGLNGRDADAAARDYITQQGYGDYYAHTVGHGVGVEIHERPSLSNRFEDVLMAGNVVTVEPGIYIPGKFGVRIEDMVYITEDGYINLTSAPKDLLVL